MQWLSDVHTQRPPASPRLCQLDKCSALSNVQVPLHSWLSYFFSTLFTLLGLQATRSSGQILDWFSGWTSPIDCGGRGGRYFRDSATRTLPEPGRSRVRLGHRAWQSRCSRSSYNRSRVRYARKEGRLCCQLLHSSSGVLSRQRWPCRDFERISCRNFGWGWRGQVKYVIVVGCIGERRLPFRFLPPGFCKDIF